MQTTIKRPAIAMIELIFAIVIMGIVMMSAPMLISTAAKSTTVALQQEGISQALSDVSAILTYDWDENATGDDITMLHVVNGDSALDASEAELRRRIGVPDYAGRSSRTFSDLNASSTLGSLGETAGKNDIDDFNGAVLDDLGGSGGKDYIEKGTVKIATSVYYASDTANYNAESISYSFSTAPETGGSTNIKTIKVTVTSTSTIGELEKEITLHAFSCNLGGYLFEERQF
ncbi:MAG: type II secretion system protein [Sulfurovum sp.]|nr:type II secretion system protein [Sulfurovum sp.]